MEVNKRKVIAVHMGKDVIYVPKIEDAISIQTKFTKRGTWINPKTKEELSL